MPLPLLAAGGRCYEAARRHWHLARHTYASVLIDGRESITVVAKRLGHANPSETLRTYSHLWPDSDERTRQVVEAAFIGRPGGVAKSR